MVHKKFFFYWFHFFLFLCQWDAILRFQFPFPNVAFIIKIEMQVQPNKGITNDFLLPSIIWHRFASSSTAAHPLPNTNHLPLVPRRKMAGTYRKPHAIMIPYPYQGHINPFVHLAIKLASKGFIITFVNTQSVHHQISKAQTGCRRDDIFAKARQSGLDIHYATVSDGFPLSFDRSLNEDQFVEGLIHVFSAHIDELVGNLVNSETEPPATCLISDTFFVWGSVIARKHNLVHVSFWTEPALVLTLYYHLDLLRQNGHFASPGEFSSDIVSMT